MNKSPFATELIEILSKAVSNKMYGSVEIYFENGNITQVTQRIIKKIKSREKNEIIESRNPSKRDEDKDKSLKIAL